MTNRWGIFLAAAVVAAAALPVRAENNVVIPKVGNYSLHAKHQTIGIEYLGYPYEPYHTEEFAFESGLFTGVEYERRFARNVALGGELVIARNKFRSTYAGSSRKGTLESNYISVHVKKYFEVTEGLLPYVGVGLGLVTANVTDNGQDLASFTGLGEQLMAGIELRVGPIGIYTEVKGVFSRIDDDENDQDMNVSGTGVLGGVSIHF